MADKKVREANKESKPIFAEKLGISRSSIYFIENSCGTFQNYYASMPIQYRT